MNAGNNPVCSNEEIINYSDSEERHFHVSIWVNHNWNTLFIVSLQVLLVSVEEKNKIYIKGLCIFIKRVYTVDE